MKKSKKLLSVLLAMIIAMSAMSAMFVSFAAAEDDLAAKINDYYAANGDKVETEEQIAEFEKLAAEFKALTDAQKDAMDVETASYLFKMADNRGAVIHKDADKAEKDALIDQYLKDTIKPSANAIKAQEFVKWFSTVTLTGYQLKTDGTIKEYPDKKLTSFTNKDYWMGAAKQGDTTLENLFAEAQKKYKDLGEAKKYVAMIYDYYGCRFNRLASYSPLQYLKVFFNMEKARMEAQNPFTGTLPKYVAKPNPDKFPGGETDPDYLAALEKYNTYLAEKAAYDKAKGLAEDPWYASAWNLMAELDPDLVGDIKDTVFGMRDALNLYVTDAAAAEAKLNELWNKYQAHLAESAVAEKAFKNADNLYVGYCEKAQINLNASKIYSEVKGIIGGPRVEAFVEAVNAATEPYTTEAVKAAQDKFALVFKESYPEISEEVKAKFRAMLSGIPASEVKPELPEYVKGEVTYPKRVPAARVELLLAELDKQIAGLFTSMGYENGTDLMQKGVYTNYAVVAAAQTVYPMLKQVLTDAGAYDTVVSLLKLDISPVGAAKLLTEDFYADAAALLNGTAEAPLAAVEDWKNVDLSKVTNGMFGFQDGDKEGFADALAVILRPVTKLLVGSVGVKLQNYYTEVAVSGSTKIATQYNYGVYEYLIPVFEMLDVELDMDSKEYTALYEEAVAYDEAKKAETGVESYTAYDQLLTPILNPALDLVEGVLASPVDALVDVLPKLAHLLNDGVLNEQLALVYDRLGLLTMFVDKSMLVIDPATIVDTVLGIVNGIELKPAVMDGDTVVTPALKLNLKFSAPDWAHLASLAAPAVKDSITADNAYRVGYETDKNAAFVATFYYLFNNITEENNFASITDVISEVVTDQATLDMINQLLGGFANISADKALEKVCTLLNIPKVEDEKPTEPTNPSENPSEKPTEPDTKPDGGDKPSVGDVAIGAFAAITLAAGAALVLSRRKK